MFRKDNSIVIDRILEKARVSYINCDFATLNKELRALEFKSNVKTLIKIISNIRLFILSFGSRRSISSN